MRSFFRFVRKGLGVLFLAVAGLLIFYLSGTSLVNPTIFSDKNINKNMVIGGLAGAGLVFLLVGSLVCGLRNWRNHFGHAMVWPVALILFSAFSVYCVTLDPKYAAHMDAVMTPPGDIKFAEVFSDYLYFAIANVILLGIGAYLLWSGSSRQPAL